MLSPTQTIDYLALFKELDSTPRGQREAKLVEIAKRENLSPRTLDKYFARIRRHEYP